MTAAHGTARIEKVVTSGTFSLDGGTWDVDNNVWLLGDDEDVLVIDAAHDADAIKAAIGSRRVHAILCTHGHNDHIDAAPALAELTGAPIWLHPADAALWGMAHPVRQPDGELHAGQVLTIAGVDVEVLHTPGHSPGAVCFSVPALGVVFSGDTLFAGGPGCDRTVVLGLPDDHRIDLAPTAEPAVGHRGAHRTRGRHDDRRRGAAPGRMGRSRALNFATRVAMVTPIAPARQARSELAAHPVLADGRVARQRLPVAGLDETQPPVEPFRSDVVVGDPEHDRVRTGGARCQTDRLHELSRHRGSAPARRDPHPDQMTFVGQAVLGDDRRHPDGCRA